MEGRKGRPAMVVDKTQRSDSLLTSATDLTDQLLRAQSLEMLLSISQILFNWCGTDGGLCNRYLSAEYFNCQFVNMAEISSLEF